MSLFLGTTFIAAGQRVLFFNKSTDDGNTFGNPIVMADSNMAGSAPAVFASADSGNLYVTWFKYTRPSPTLFFKKSTDSGATFGDAVRIDTNGTIQSSIVGIFASPHANNNDDNVGIIWFGFSANNGTGEVFLSKSTDGGRSFGRPVLLGKSTADSHPVPRMVQTGNEAYVLWSSGGDNGRHFVTKIDIADYKDQFYVGPAVNLGNIGASVIAASGNNVYVAVTAVSGSTGDGGSSEGAGGVSILLLKSDDGGRSFGKPPTTLATYNNTDSNHINSLALDVSKNFVYLTWYNAHSRQIGAEIDVIASSDYGNTFGSIQKINSGNNPSEPVVASASGDRYYVSWQGSDSVNGTAYQKLFFTSSSDYGNTFGKTLDLTGDAGISNPEQAMTADDNNDHVYVAWLDFGFKDGNHIMFTKNTDSGDDHFSNAIDLDKDSQTVITKIATETPSSSPEFASSFAPIAILAGTVGVIILAARIGKLGPKRR